jgi:glycosyltransferase involved in cell wall biosynthesis
MNANPLELNEGVAQSVRPQVSVVVPVLNEEENLPKLFERICSAFEGLNKTWEVIFVDDGSTDGTFKVLQKLQQSHDALHIVRLRRNFGQTAAMVAGFDYAIGETIIPLDGDLQNDPKDIGALLNKMEEGYDVVSGWRVNRQDGFFLRRLPSILANWLISKTTGTYLHDYGCTLKAYRSEMIKEVRLYGEMHRFIPALVGGNGARIAEIPVNHYPRQHGKSKYGISRTVRVLLDLLMIKFFLSFSTKPLQAFGLVGILSFVPGSAIVGYLGLSKLIYNESLADRPLLLLGILLIVVGAQFISMGLLAEIQTRTYHETANKPIYSIREVLGSRSTQPKTITRMPRAYRS